MKSILKLTLTAVVLLFVCVLTFTACNEKDHEHTWGEWNTIENASCTKEGKQERSCSCGEKEYLTIAMTGHTIGEWVVVSEATCIEIGTRSQSCMICHATIDTEIIQPVGHTESDWYVEREASCTLEGARHKVCTICNVHTIDEILPALGHQSAGAATESQAEICGVCGIELAPKLPSIIIEGAYTSGLIYTLNPDGQSYSVSGIDTERSIGDLRIPDKYNGLPVTEIADYAFSNYRGTISQVYLGKNIKVIGPGAFQGCSELSGVVFSESIKTIKALAFDNCGLVSITVPDTVTCIESTAFHGCNKLERISIPFVGIGNGAEPYNMENDTYGSSHFGIIFDTRSGGNSTVPKSLKKVIVTNATAIDSHAFADCSYIEEIELNKEIAAIGSYAFYGMHSLLQPAIPESVTEIAPYAFYDCSSLVTVSEILHEKITRIGEFAFAKCVSLHMVNIPAGVQYIDSGAFAGCTSLVGWGVSSPSSLKHIGSNVLYQCNNIYQMTIPFVGEGEGATLYQNADGVLSIRCTTSLGYLFGGFNNDSVPSTLNILSITDAEWLDIRALSGCTSIKGLYLPETMSFIDAYAFEGMTNLYELDLPDALTAISEGCFYGCTNLWNMTLHEGIVSIGDFAFFNCTNFRDGGVTLKFPESVTSIGRYAFANCNIWWVELPDGVKEIKDGTFSGCTLLATITFADDLKAIGSEAFKGSRLYKTFVIPSTVDTIGERAFEDCKDIPEIYIESPYMPSGWASNWNPDNIPVVWDSGT